MTSDTDLLQKIEHQRTFFQTGVTKDTAFRKEALLKLKKWIQENEQKIYAALWSDLRKSAQEAYLTEISIVLQEISLHLQQLSRWTKPQRVKSTLAIFPSQSWIYHEPYGTVLIIAPWNYPFQLILNPLIGAISAGNCATLKASPYAPATSALLKEMVLSTYPQEYISLVEGEKEVNTLLLSMQWDYIFFTGSPSFGKAVMEAAAQQLTPLTLELGGKSPCIVDASASIDIAAKRIVWGKLINAGQTCVAPDYFFVHRSIEQELIQKIKHYIELFYGKNPQKSKYYPRIVNQAAFDRLLSLMQEGVVIHGGDHDKDDLYIEPTIIDNLPAQAQILEQEIFGPLFPIIPIDDLSQVSDYLKKQSKPLALYYFGDTKRGEDLIRRTSSGGACINDVLLHVANHRLPFGGVGNSGIGKYHGKYSFETFSNLRSVVVSSVRFDLFAKYVPFRFFGFLKRFI